MFDRIDYYNLLFPIELVEAALRLKSFAKLNTMKSTTTYIN
ncbi:MAG: hypothetical protein ACI97K_002830 [Glaciecola sp.]|jgi:hypothetical protein